VLFRIDAKGRYFQIKQMPFQKEYAQRKLRLKKGEFEKVYGFLELEIDKPFSVATKYPRRNRHAWGGALRYLYLSTGKNVKQAGYFLGMIMMDVTIHMRSKWACIKTNIIAHTPRDFETNYYFKPTIRQKDKK